MNSAAIDIDVLIVGAGPVGLFLANECARRGLRWRLVEAPFAVGTLESPRDHAADT
jgi:2-polyprenyl-6-methoxyphenol hydroxylase-like FAD-dependent oxidoreductase